MGPSNPTGSEQRCRSASWLRPASVYPVQSRMNCSIARACIACVEPEPLSRAVPQESVESNLYKDGAGVQMESKLGSHSAILGSTPG